MNLSFGKRDKETLYDLKKDLTVKNIAKFDKYKSLKDSLKKILIEDLTKNKDPRITGEGDIFDNYIYAEKEPETL